MIKNCGDGGNCTHVQICESDNILHTLGTVLHAHANEQVQLIVAKQSKDLSIYL